MEKLFSKQRAPYCYLLQHSLELYRARFANGLMGTTTVCIFFLPFFSLDNKGVFSVVKHSLSGVCNHWRLTFFVQPTSWLYFLCPAAMIQLNELAFRQKLANTYP